MTLFLDTDIGTDVDDALALALIAGSPELELAGISTVYGDTALRARLARRYLRIAGRNAEIPIAAGTEVPLSGREVWWPGHEGALFEDLADERVDPDGVRLLAETVARHRGEIDVLAIGPLTNIAAALESDPSFESNVRRLVIMGADFRPHRRIPEHNIKSDVDSARRVFASGLDIHVGGLELTTRFWLDSRDVDVIEGAGALGAVLAREMTSWWNFTEADGNTPHDPLLALYLARPDLFTATRATVEVDDDGMTSETVDPAGNVLILDAERIDVVKDELMRRVCAGAESITGLRV
ncbi:nucleoside hydrolase [Microbacterium hibisci]|uniref:nucleoside hydrolase n=1 Tax=Microbacterium hibisci TaxID=2036000 RepID=UPI001EF2475A|nr:nucleoside hydrolase [Microbacterium hibisci]